MVPGTAEKPLQRIYRYLLNIAPVPARTGRTNGHRNRSREKQAAIRTQINKLLELGVIEESQASEWSQVHPIPATKSLEGWRISNILETRKPTLWHRGHRPCRLRACRDMDQSHSVSMRYLQRRSRWWSTIDNAEYSMNEVYHLTIIYLSSIFHLTIIYQSSMYFLTKGENEGLQKYFTTE
jgi:hypothetical protein